MASQKVCVACGLMHVVISACIPVQIFLQLEKYSPPPTPFSFSTSSCSLPPHTRFLSLPSLPPSVVLPEEDKPTLDSNKLFFIVLNPSPFTAGGVGAVKGEGIKTRKKSLLESSVVCLPPVILLLAKQHNVFTFYTKTRSK